MGDGLTDTIATLQHVLASAIRIAQDLTADPLVPRILEVFGRMPAEDREVVLGVVDREVDLRNLARDAPHAVLSGVNVTRPNPNARLYFRVADGDAPPHVTPEEVVQAVIRAARVAHRAAGRGTDLGARWGREIVEGMRRIEPEERASLRRYHRTMLDLLDRAERTTD